MSAQFKIWGTHLEEEAIQQMRDAVSLPVAVSGALMPDAHTGYGLPIGGVLATENAVIPYGVGVDIACRMMLTIFDVHPNVLKQNKNFYKKAIEENTRFGVGAEWKEKKQHHVLEEDWNITSFIKELKDKAHKQLGTSGSGNHFVEFGEITFDEEAVGISQGTYLALLSHSGSRGAGAAVASHYTKIAKSFHPELEGRMKNLAWLDLNNDGAEYWAAMELMGKYASANHHVIHQEISNSIGHSILKQVENHHNFAWKEIHNGKEVIVHRKGATPAGKGVLGIIPGSMASPGFLVEGLGNSESLNSTSHGAGRKMSRTQALKNYTWKETLEYLRKQNVELISAGLDEVPWAYKNIRDVMNAQLDLAKPLATFMPRIVKMAPAGERAED